MNNQVGVKFMLQGMQFLAVGMDTSEIETVWKLYTQYKTDKIDHTICGDFMGYKWIIALSDIVAIHTVPIEAIVQQQQMQVRTGIGNTNPPNLLHKPFQSGQKQN